MLNRSTGRLGSVRAAMCAPSQLHLVMCVALIATSALSTSAWSADNTEVSQLRKQVDEIRQQYEARLKALEDKLDQVQKQQAAASNNTDNNASPAAQAPAVTSSTATNDTGGAAASGGGGGFNPAVSVILSGLYASLSKDPSTWHLGGFAPSGDEIGPGKRGFSLGESEMGLSANIDPWLYGNLTLSVSGDDKISAEEAFVQTISLPDAFNGIKIKAGRFFSGLGYLNEQHAHTWDFVDAPLAYQAFLGGQYKQDGVQGKWLLPVDEFVEVGAELGSGANFPGTDRNRNGAGAVSVFAHTGGDVGDSHSWRAGLSWLRNQAQDRPWDTTNALNQNVTNAFTAQSRLWVVDGVWKWAPNGNATRTNFKLQGEYFRRIESGSLTYAYADPDQLGLSANTDAYRSAQSGWYLQGIYQFMPAWRVGLRHDQLNSGNTDLASNSLNLSSIDYSPKRNSLMLDWSPSEFQRWRIQLSDDRSREGINDRQLFLQYQTSLGAHGAHSY
jgi:hypothetical protein